jgi:hypothetical protein
VLAFERQQTIPVRQDHGLYSHNGVKDIIPIAIMEINLVKRQLRDLAERIGALRGFL